MLGKDALDTVELEADTLGDLLATTAELPSFLRSSFAPLLPAASAIPRLKLAATCFSPSELSPPSCLFGSPPPPLSIFTHVSLISLHPFPTLSIASIDRCSHSSMRALSFCPSSMRSLSERTPRPSRSRSLTSNRVKPHRMNVPEPRNNISCTDVRRLRWREGCVGCGCVVVEWFDVCGAV